MSNIHHVASAGFAAQAAAYAKGRPDYPPEAGDWLRGDLALREGKRALDLGSGTGKFLPRLLSTGASIVAVEPLAEMRAYLTAAFPQVEAKEGRAQQIPLPDGSVDAVTCAQCFHWFANAEALAEVRRVLKPGGALGLIWNIRDAGVPWVAEVIAIMAPHEPDLPRYETMEWRKAFPAEGFGPLMERQFRNDHTGVPENVIINRALSVSFIAALPAAEQGRVIAQLRDLIARTPELANNDEVTFPHNTYAYSCRKLG